MNLKLSSAYSMLLKNLEDKSLLAGVNIESYKEEILEADDDFKEDIEKFNSLVSLLDKGVDEESELESLIVLRALTMGMSQELDNFVVELTEYIKKRNI